MSDYELVYLFVEHNNALQTSLMNYVAVLFGFLITGYLVASKLESRMVFVVVAMFTLVAVPEAINVIGFGSDTAALGSQIAARAAENPAGLGWHGTASAALGVVGLPVLRFSTIVVMVLSYIGALVFFFHQRRIGKTQLQEETQ